MALPPYPPMPRPQAVTAAAMVMVLSTLTNVGSGLFIGFDMTATASGTESDGGHIGAVIVGFIAIVLGIGFSVLAVGVLRGNNVARILAMTGSGLVLCCGGLAAIALVAGIQANGVEEPSQVVVTVFDFVNLVAAPTVIILLALPSTNHWYRYVQQTRAVTIPANHPGY